jgi:flagellar basal-body rod modification protein FlgD
MINSIGTQTTVGATAAKNGTARDQMDFTALLVKQLQTQDPMEPMSTQDMMAQLTQTQMAQQITGLRQDGQAALKTAAAALMGKTVGGSTTDGVQVSGRVDGLVWGANEPMLIVGTTQLPLSGVTMVLP